MEYTGQRLKTRLVPLPSHPKIQNSVHFYSSSLVLSFDLPFAPPSELVLKKLQEVHPTDQVWKLTSLYRERYLALCFDQETATALVNSSPVNLDGNKMFIERWSPEIDSTLLEGLHLVRLRLTGIPLFAHDKVTIEKILRGWADLAHLDDTAFGLEDLGESDLTIQVWDIGDIPEKILLHLGNRRYVISTRLIAWTEGSFHSAKFSEVVELISLSHGEVTILRTQFAEPPPFHQLVGIRMIGSPVQIPPVITQETMHATSFSWPAPIRPATTVSDGGGLTLIRSQSKLDLRRFDATTGHCSLEDAFPVTRNRFDLLDNGDDDTLALVRDTCDSDRVENLHNWPSQELPTPQPMPPLLPTPRGVITPNRPEAENTLPAPPPAAPPMADEAITSSRPPNSPRASPPRDCSLPNIELTDGLIIIGNKAEVTTVRRSSRLNTTDPKPALQKAMKVKEQKNLAVSGSSGSSASTKDKGNGKLGSMEIPLSTKVADIARRSGFLEVDAELESNAALKDIAKKVFLRKKQ